MVPGGKCALLTRSLFLPPHGSYPACICNAGSAGARCEVVYGCTDPKASNFNHLATKMCAKVRGAKHNCCTYRAGCASQPCKHGGKCALVHGKVVCTCTAASKAYGTRCEKRDVSNDCRRNPCAHGGRCTDIYDGGRDTYGCNCAKGWTGSKSRGANLRDCNQRVGSCSFERGTCGWAERLPHGFVNPSGATGYDRTSNAWRIGTSTPSSSTGPTSGEWRGGTSGKKFVYLETSSPMTTGQKSFLTSPTGSYTSLQFSYYMCVLSSLLSSLFSFRST